MSGAYGVVSEGVSVASEDHIAALPQYVFGLAATAVAGTLVFYTLAVVRSSRKKIWCVRDSNKQH